LKEKAVDYLDKCLCLNIICKTQSRDLKNEFMIKIIKMEIIYWRSNRLTHTQTQ